MQAIPGMEHSRVAAGRIDGEIDGKIAQSHLIPGRMNRPLIMQQGVSIRLQAGKHAWRRIGQSERRREDASKHGGDSGTKREGHR